MDFTIPHTMEIEHEELHKELRKGTREGGKTGEAAKKVAKILHPHFVKEEDFALPPLGLLPLLSKGRVTPDMKDILLMTDKLKTELNQMLKEHKQILNALKNLVAAAKKERKLEYLRFAHRLTLHAQAEEELYYPAAILVGEYVKLRLRK
jgi:hemerythrin superfamily protein